MLTSVKAAVVESTCGSRPQHWYPWYHPLGTIGCKTCSETRESESEDVVDSDEDSGDSEESSLRMRWKLRRHIKGTTMTSASMTSPTVPTPQHRAKRARLPSALRIPAILRKHDSAKDPVKEVEIGITTLGRPRVRKTPHKAAPSSP
ncbi:hypothetical protein BGX38DRAFT_1276743 [Terfezia claveryi]|nr:hypothetical protein BGX38DRAFT_1276743 [Terfezia claveryi]